MNSFLGSTLNSWMPMPMPMSMPMSMQMPMSMPMPMPMPAMNFDTLIFNNYALFQTPVYNMPQNNWFGMSNFSTINQGSSSIPTSSNKGSASIPHWSKMSDSEMKELYGNYNFDVTEKYTGTAEDLDKFLDKYPMLNGKGHVFMEAQEKYGINALAMIAICGAETSYGTKGNNKDFYNIVNIEKPKGADYPGRWKRYDSVDECIMDLARLLKNNYVDSPGNGKVEHLTKLYQINARYCPASETSSNSGWAKLVTSCLNNVKKGIA